MTMIQIVESSESTTGEGRALYVTLATDKVSAFVAVYSDGALQVCTLNAANRAFRGMGRRFESVDAALAGYKSAGMRTLIRAAVDLASPVEVKSVN